MDLIEIETKKLALARNWSIAVAESLTAGQLQSQIASVSGSSEYFLGGITAYNIDQKVNLLGIDREHAKSVNCVSERVAQEMAVGVRKLFGSTIGLATTGYAEPWPVGNVEQPFACFAIDIGGVVTVGRIEAAGRSRVDVQTFVAEEVLSKFVEMAKEA